MFIALKNIYSYGRDVTNDYTSDDTAKHKIVHYDGGREESMKILNKFKGQVGQVWRFDIVCSREILSIQERHF